MISKENQEEHTCIVVPYIREVITAAVVGFAYWEKDVVNECRYNWLLDSPEVES